MQVFSAEYCFLTEREDPHIQLVSGHNFMVDLFLNISRAQIKLMPLY